MGYTAAEKMHKEEKIEEEKEGKKDVKKEKEGKRQRELRWRGRGTSLGPIRRNRRAPVITNPPLAAAYTPMNIRFLVPL